MNHNNKPCSACGKDAGIVLLALVLPTCITLLYFVLLARFPAGVQQIAYGIGKAIQFALPIVWVFRVQRRQFHWQKPRCAGMLSGSLFGLAVMAAIVLIYAMWLKPIGYLDESSQVTREIQAKVLGLRFNTTIKYIGLGIFYSLVHSGLEEYYWRWFVFGQLCQLARLPVAIALSSFGFMLHHILVLGTYFGYLSLATWIFSLSIAAGGAFWAWIYYRTDSIYAPWVSHLLVDAAIFAVGFDMVRHLFH